MDEIQITENRGILFRKKLEKLLTDQKIGSISTLAVR